VKLWVVALVAAFLLAGCASTGHRNESYTNEAWIIEKDPLNTDRWVLRNKYGDLIGYAERDLLSPDRIIIRNKYGDRTDVIINGEPFK
jgi:hypothetical protein